MLKFTIKLLPIYIALIQCNHPDDDKLKNGISPGFQNDNLVKTTPNIPPPPNHPEYIGSSEPNKEKNKDKYKRKDQDKHKEEFDPLTDQLIIDDDNLQPCDALQTILYATFSDKSHVSVLNKNRDTPLKQVLFDTLIRIHKKEKINRKELLEQFKKYDIDVNGVVEACYKLHEILSGIRYQPVGNSKDYEYESVLKVFKNPKESLAIHIGNTKYDYKYTTEYSVWTPKHIWGNDQIVKLYEKTAHIYQNPIMKLLLENKIQGITNVCVMNIVRPIKTK